MDSKKILQCEMGCKPSYDPFYIDVLCVNECLEELGLPLSDIGVLCGKDGEPTERWQNGAYGVSEELQDELSTAHTNCLQCIKCNGVVIEIEA